jgi:hypothetical protein
MVECSRYADFRSTFHLVERSAEAGGIHVLRGWPLWLLAVAGVAVAGAGVYRVVVTAGGSGGIVAVTAGSLLLVSPFVIRRVEQLSVTTSGLEMRLSRDIAELGAPKAARILDRTDLAWYAQSYSFIHRELGAEDFKDAKVHLQDLLVDRAAAVADREKFDASEVRTLFQNGTPTMRVLALGLMQGDPSLADERTLLGAITNPLSPNEQYQGLKLAEQSWLRLKPASRAAVQAAIEASPEIKAGGSRRAVAEKIVALPTA